MPRSSSLAYRKAAAVSGNNLHIESLAAGKVPAAAAAAGPEGQEQVTLNIVMQSRVGESTREELRTAGPGIPARPRVALLRSVQTALLGVTALKVRYISKLLTRRDS